MSTFKDLKYKFNRFEVFDKIITVNVIVFVVGLVCSGLFKLNLFNYFELPSGFSDFIRQPWSLLTYGFLHSGFLHLVFNMWLLYYLSRVATNLFRYKMILNVYFLGIIFGAITFLVAYNFMPSFFKNPKSVLLGASAGISALLLFIATYMPDSEIRLFNTINVKWKHIAMIFVSFDVIRIVMGINQGGYIAHLGGYILGYLYAARLQQGKDIGTGFEKTMDAVFSWSKPKSNLKTVHRKQQTTGDYAGKTKQEFNTYNKQKKIDLILDKIGKSGYESLTAEEKEFLFKAGKD